MKPRQPRYGDIFAAHENAALMAERARTLWAELLDELMARGDLTKSRAGMIDRLVRARVEYEFLYPIAMHEGPCRVSDSGGEYANMKWSAVAKLSEQCLKLELALQLSPQKPEGERKDRPKMPDAAGKYLERASKAH